MALNCQMITYISLFTFNIMLIISNKYVSCLFANLGSMMLTQRLVACMQEHLYYILHLTLF